STRVTAPVRYEAPEPGAQPYPHLYGPLSTDAVIAVLPVGRDETGKMLLPGNGATATLTGADRTRQVPEEGDVRERQEHAADAKTGGGGRRRVGRLPRMPARR